MEKFDYLGLNGRQLRLFLTVMDKGSLAAASEALDLNQSTVSQHIAALEEDGHFRLLAKATGGLDHGGGASPGRFRTTDEAAERDRATAVLACTHSCVASESVKRERYRRQ